MKKELRKAEEKEKWREKANNRERLKKIATVKYYWRYVNATNNNALYTQGLIFTAHTNTSTLLAPNSLSPSVTTHLPIHLITPGNIPVSEPHLSQASTYRVSHKQLGKFMLSFDLLCSQSVYKSPCLPHSPQIIKHINLQSP